MGFYYYGPEEKRNGAEAAVKKVLQTHNWVDILRVYYRTDTNKPMFQVVAFGGSAERDDDYWIPEQED